MICVDLFSVDFFLEKFLVHRKIECPCPLPLHTHLLPVMDTSHLTGGNLNPHRVITGAHHLCQASLLVWYGVRIWTVHPQRLYTE